MDIAYHYLSKVITEVITGKKKTGFKDVTLIYNHSRFPYASPQIRKTYSPNHYSWTVGSLLPRRRLGSEIRIRMLPSLLRHIHRETQKRLT
jgi:hypothetical protein